MIKQFAALIPESLLCRSGSVFYSGRRAFSQLANVYLLGINPGGNPLRQVTETISWHTEKILRSTPELWSEYSDESWEGKPPGTHGMQPRVCHLLRQLGLDPRTVPASNLIFVRTSIEKGIGSEKDKLIDLCWPFHEHVIRTLRPQAVICFGQTVGNYVREQLSADDLVGQFIENNHRRWASTAHASRGGPAVLTVTHPSRANWRKPDTDPSTLVNAVLNSTGEHPSPSDEVG